jgi:hypothetical protein
MSAISLPENAGRVGTFTRIEEGVTVHMEAVVPVDPVSGAPLDLATNATLAALSAAVATLNTAASAIQSAVEAMNAKVTAVNTGAIAGTVALDSDALAALENMMVTVSHFPDTQPVSGSVNVGNLPAVQDVAVNNLPAAISSVAQDATVQAINDLNDTMLSLLSAMFEKMPRLDKTDRVSVDLSELGIGGTPYGDSYVNGVSNPKLGQGFYRLFEPWNFSDAGAARLYQQIIVS